MGPRVNGESGQSGFSERDAEQPLRKAQDFFVPEDLHQLARRADTSVAPARQRARAVGGIALTGAPTKQGAHNPHQIWEGFEFPTDNWF